jgi:type IV pilus assembly protein PilC
VNLVAAGEVGGILDTILNRLAAYLEKADKLARKVRGAMVYPTTVMVVAIAVVVLLLVKVIPTFEKMFADFGGELPGQHRSSSASVTSCKTGLSYLWLGS